MIPLLPENLNLKPRCSALESMLNGTRAIVLDNGVLRLSILPEFGGRLCSLFYRPANLELLATEFIHSTGHRGFTVRGGWCAAFPSLLADGEEISHQSWTADISEQTEQQVTVRMQCLVERISHRMGGEVRLTPATVLVERFIRLKAGEGRVTVEDVLTNRNAWPQPVTWSGVVCLRAHPGDRAVMPTEGVEVQRGVGPEGNELDFGLMVNTPYQALARNLRDGWLGFRSSVAPIDLRLTFPRDLLPHAVIMAQRDDQHPAEDAFRFQPLATPGPIADDSRGGALVLPPKAPLSLPLTLEVGAGILSAGVWSRPGLQLSELITEQHVPMGRVALWRVGALSIVLKTTHHLLIIMPEFLEETLLLPEDLPNADLILCAAAPSRAMLRRLVPRTTSRFIGPPELRQALLTDGVGGDRSVALSPGARFDLPGLGILATPARGEYPEERLGFLLQIEHLQLYHAGPTDFLGEFGPIGEQFHPQLVFLPVTGTMTMADTVHAARQLQPRVAVPLGDEDPQRDFVQRCRGLHVNFAAQALYPAEGALFDGWHLNPLNGDQGEGLPEG